MNNSAQQDFVKSKDGGIMGDIPLSSWKQRCEMSELKQKISALFSEFETAIVAIKTLKDLEQIRIAFLGKQGKIPPLFQELKQATPDEKKECGPLINELKKQIDEHIAHTKTQLIEKQARNAQLKQQHFDVTAYPPQLHPEHLHPHTQLFEEIENIFISMGYDVLDGPYVETDFYNFTALNIPCDHPARDMYDTFWLNKKNHLLRTHTSTVQIHAMQQQKPPIAIIAPGYAFRHEALDASHDIMFNQCEGILIDKNVTLSHLFATVQAFLKAFLKLDTIDIRIRPGFFPFVEPGFEIDMRCPFCENGCSVCKKTTWIEVFPGGLIHPNVLKAGGIDPEQYSGFAFGFGATRLAMLFYKINDVRLLLSGKTKFLEQF